jgi:prepilin-type N-terminal cleavage/methylation domain-containing protein
MRRRAYTTIELLIVMVITGVMAAAVTKPISRTWRESSRQAAGRETAAYLYRARAAAVQQSRTTWFVRSGDIIKILTDSSGVVVPFGSPLNMNARHGVTVEATRDTITFDPRGFTRLLTPAPRLIVRNTSGADTLCITGLGTISTRTCS